VVITGLGAVTPIGNTRDEFWKHLVAGESGVATITAFDPSDFSTKFAAEVKDFDAEALIGRREAKRMDRFAQMAFVAAREAVEDAAIPEDSEFRQETGAIIGTGIGGIMTLEFAANKANKDQNWSKVSPFFIPILMGNAAPAHISPHYAFRGSIFPPPCALASSTDTLSAPSGWILLAAARALLPPASQTDYDAALAKAKLSPENMDREKPWLASLQLLIAESAAKHYSADAGVDNAVMAIAARRHKPSR